MTEPYTTRELPEVVNWIGEIGSEYGVPVASPYERDMATKYARLAATLREYERVVEGEAMWAATVERQRKSLDRYREQRAALEADKDHLARLAGKLLEQFGDGGVPDGGEMQELLVEAGVIAPVEVTESCGENCNCAEWDFPTTCYRKTPLGDYCAARAAGEG